MVFDFPLIYPSDDHASVIDQALLETLVKRGSTRQSSCRLRHHRAIDEKLGF
jgi:hypothetical protein